MNQLQSIVVGIDYSECCENALREAFRIANWNDAHLVCLHVIDDEILRDFRNLPDFDETAVLSESESKLEDYVARIAPDGAAAETRVAVGHPFRELIRAVDETAAELLILGSRGCAESDASRTGMFAKRCVRKAPCEVLLVRKSQSEPFRRIGVCVDFSKNSKRAAERAMQIASQDGSRVDFIHVYVSPILAAGDIGGLGPSLPPQDVSGWMNDLEDRLRKLAKKLGKEFPEVETSVEVVEAASPATGAAKALRDKDADLVVLGTRGRTGLKKLLLGTTAERLIHDTPCSALAVKPKGFEFKLK